MTDRRGELASSLLVARGNGDGTATDTLTQGGPTNLVDHIQHTAQQWDHLNHPHPSRLGITTGPPGHTIWLDTSTHTIANQPTPSQSG